MIKLPKKLISTKLVALYLVTISLLVISTIILQTLALNDQIKKADAQFDLLDGSLKQFRSANLLFHQVATLSAARMGQGVEVATVEASLEETRQQILKGHYSSASATLTQLSSTLDDLLTQKLEADRIATEAAKKKAEEEARRKAEQEAQRKAEEARRAQIQATTPTTTTSTNPTSLGTGYSRTTISTSRGNFTINLIKVNLAGRRVVMDSANDSDCANNCPTKPLADYISANGASYGINGTYFCPPDYASCSGKVGSFDFPIFNTRLGRWLNQGNLYWNNRAMMTFSGGSAAFYPNAAAAPTGGMSAAIVSNPGLLHNDQDITGQYSLTSAQTTKGTRGGLGINGSTLFMVIASSANMGDLAAIFQALGASHALNIDGGGSSAMWAGGYKVGPGRLLPNALVIQ